MATVKLQNGRVVLKNAKVSCDCCIECQMPNFLSNTIIITKEQYEALGRGGSAYFLFNASSSDSSPQCEDTPSYYESTTIGVSFSNPIPECVATGPIVYCPPGPNSCVGNSTILWRAKEGSDYLFTIGLFSNGGYSGPNFYLTRPGSGNPSYITSASLSVIIDGENIPCEFYVGEGIGCDYSLEFQFNYVSNP